MYFSFSNIIIYLYELISKFKTISQFNPVDIFSSMEHLFVCTVLAASHHVVHEVFPLAEVPPGEIKVCNSSISNAHH